MSSGSEAQFGLGDSVLTLLQGLKNSDPEITWIINNHRFCRGDFPAVQRMLVQILEASLLW